MELDYFDEARKCSKCQVVTYCDRCPICGKLLPRSSYAMGKRKHKLLTKGEEVVSQPKNHEVHRGHIKERIMEARQTQTNTVEAFHKAGNKNRQTKRNMDDLIGLKLDNSSHRRQSRSQNAGLMIWIGFVAIAICIGIGISVRQYLSNDTWEETEETNEFYLEKLELFLDPVNPKAQIYEEIDLSHVMYAEYDDTIRAYVKHKQNECRYVDMEFYAEGEKVASQYGVVLMPYENIDYDMDANGIPDTYELTDSGTCGIGVTAPDFTYQTYWGFDMMSVAIEEEVTQSDVEILVRYLYEASKYRDQDQIKTMLVYLNNGNSYSITLADGKATGIYSGSSYDGFHPIEISIS